MKCGRSEPRFWGVERPHSGSLAQRIRMAAAAPARQHSLHAHDYEPRSSSLTALSFMISGRTSGLISRSLSNDASHRSGLITG